MGLEPSTPFLPRSLETLGLLWWVTGLGIISRTSPEVDRDTPYVLGEG